MYCLEGFRFWHSLESEAEVMQPFLHFSYCQQVHGSEHHPQVGQNLLDKINPQAGRDFSRTLFTDRLLACLILSPFRAI